MPIWAYVLIILAVAFGTWTMIYMIFVAGPKSRNSRNQLSRELASYDRYMAERSLSRREVK